MSVARAYLDLARASYRTYCYLTHEGRWAPGKAVSYLCDEVQKFLASKSGAAYEILVISMPPQHGKSMALTETLPSFYLGRHPDDRVIEISYSEDFAQLFGRRNRAKMEQFGKELFGVSLAASPASATEFEIAGHSGGMISRGILSGVTGRACNLMIIDDPIKTRLEADSEAHRRRLFDEWENSFKTRLAAGAKVILIQTRWHEDDLAGRILAQEKNVRLINLPCEAEENDPLGRRVGEALCPEIGKDDLWLRDFKRSYLTQSGSRAWNALFQGKPTAAEGNLIRREWWKFYTTLPTLPTLILSVDAAFKGGEQSDFVAIQAWGKRGGDCYLIDAMKERMGFPETLEAIRGMKARYPSAQMILIEDKANGPAILQVLQREIPGMVPVNPEGGKVARANAVSGAIEAGNVYLPAYASFTGGFLEECSAFPNGAHDDQVDCMTQALSRLLYWPSEPPTPPDPDEVRYDEQVESLLEYGG